MRAFFYSLPLLVVLAGASALFMMVPAIVALDARDHESAQAFFWSAIFTLIVSGMVAIVTQGRRGPSIIRSQLWSLLGVFVGFPLILALPFHGSLGNTSWTNAYFEMVSAITTTGASVYVAPGRLSAAEEVWRAIVAWGGGLFMWSAAVALLAPMGLGGYEVAQPRGPVAGSGALQGQERFATERFLRAISQLAPIYAGLTLLLFMALLVAGDAPLTAAVHATSTLATAGLSPVGGIENATSGRIGEFVVVLFFVFALSRRTFSTGVLAEDTRDITEDPELRIAVILVATLAVGLFLRHYVAASQTSGAAGVISAVQALWGTIFTALSFLTTTGYASADWLTARSWSGIEAPGLLLMGLALIGGGVATTAGGVKLLRIYALLKHGEREIGRLVFPNSVAGAGRYARHLRREGAFIAWIVFMLLAVSVCITMLALSAAGTDFEAALILTVAALTNTGPLANFAADTPIQIAALSEGAKFILAAAMVIGRLETLVIVALLNPSFWRV